MFLQVIIKGACTGMPVHLINRAKQSRVRHAETWLVPSCQGCDILAREGKDVALRQIIGVALWVVGWSVNLHSDHILRTLRKPGQRGASH